MKILSSIKEYAKTRGLSEQAVRKQVASKLCESIVLDKITYIVEDDTAIKKLKQNIKNKNSQIRELKLKLEIKTAGADDKYIKELEKQIVKLEKTESKLETKLAKKDKKIEKLHKSKDTLYENILGTILNNKKALEK